MTRNYFSILLDLVIMGYVGYVVWLYADMMRTGKLQQNLMIPGEIRADLCRSVAAYIAFMGPRILLSGMATLGCGLIFLPQDKTGTFSLALPLAPVVVFLVLCSWYAGKAGRP